MTRRSGASHPDQPLEVPMTQTILADQPDEQAQVARTLARA